MTAVLTRDSVALGAETQVRTRTVAIDEVLGRAFGKGADPGLGVTLAVVVERHGEVVAERYGPETDEGTTLISWSMAKSILHALVGTVVADGLLDLDAPAPVPEWADPEDPRHPITTDQLLRMCSGLRFCEDYVDDQVSDVITMLFGDGRHDMAAFAAGFPLEHPPGTVFNYSSGTSNIVAGIVGRLLGGREAVEARLQDRLFDPLGMTSATARFDDAGTFVGSSYVYATARDFARFGCLYLQRGRWEGEEVLPVGWVDHATRRTPLDTGEGEQPYGAHWWLVEDPAGSFAAQGYEGQRTLVVPDLDLVVVRLGKTVADLKPNLDRWLAELVVAVRAS
jgi:CubicO group peptidase (beta-lactamase class C family)